MLVRLQSWARQLKQEIYALALAYIALAVRLIPPAVLVECRTRAAATAGRRPVNWVAAGVIIAIWLILAALAVALVVRMFSS